MSEMWGHTIDFVEAEMRRLEIVGLSLGVYHEGQVLVQGLGKTSIDHPQDVSPDTLFQIGSVNKTYTGTLVMQLLEAGKLRLEDKVRQYLPYFTLADEDVAANVTIRHLLNHTGGWDGDFFEDSGLGEEANKRYIEKLNSRKPFAPLGKVFSYNNSGFAVLAAIIEEIYGKSLDVVLREQIFSPLEMDKSFANPLDVMPHRFALGHFKVERIRQVDKVWPLGRSYFGMGSIHSNVRDQLQYAQAYLNGGCLGEKRILEEQSIQAMWTSEAQINRSTAMGLTWFLEELEGLRLVHHGGATAGQLAFLCLIPEKHFAFTVLTNSGYVRPFVMKHLKTHLLKEYFGIDIPKPRPEKVPAELRDALGTGFRNQQACFEMSSLGDSLVGRFVELSEQEGSEEQASPPFGVAALDEDTLIILDGDFKDSTIDIVRAEDGSIANIRASLRIYWRKD